MLLNTVQYPSKNSDNSVCSIKFSRKWQRNTGNFDRMPHHQ